jgi:hypothetical protein
MKNQNNIDLKELENEIKKFFNDMIHTPNPKVNFEVNGDIITIKELKVKKDEEEKNEDKCDKIDIELPKNISYIPFKAEAKSQKRYSLIGFKKGKHFESCKSGKPLCGIKDNKKGMKGGMCEIGLMIKDENIYLIFVELKSTLSMTTYCQSLNKLKYSFYLVMLILKFFDIEPDYYGLIIGCGRNELDIGKLDPKHVEYHGEIIDYRVAIGEYYLTYDVDWTYNTKKKFKIHIHNPHSILLKWSDIKPKFTYD